MHIHARDENGEPTQSAEIYREIKEEIENRCDVIFQPSTGGAVHHSPQERMQSLECGPEMATLSTGTCNFGTDVFMNNQVTMETFAQRMLELGVKPEIECFERGMIQNALKLAGKGLLQMPLHFDFVLGIPGACPAQLRDLLYLSESLPDRCTWTAAATGKNQLPTAVAAILLGGHVRVGFEDNIYYRKGELAQSNAQLVERVVRIAEELGREIATVAEARRILSIPQKKEK